MAGQATSQSPQQDYNFALLMAAKSALVDRGRDSRGSGGLQMGCTPTISAINRAEPDNCVIPFDPTSLQRPPIADG